MNWGTLDAATVSRWVNFSGEETWQYDQDNRESMAAKQTEGVAYLWNLLSEHGVALLADEVGMGKTFQAIGVAAMLWKVKPDARVLVMAPNRDICYHWRRELDGFVRNHYRDTDHNVKNSIDGGPVPSVQLCFGLESLASAVERGAGHLYVTTIHSLSGLVPSCEKASGNLALKARKAAGKLHKRIKSALSGEGFDLVILDEAHYLRNRDGGSQRVSAAKAFFGDETSRLAQRNLLLTATPSHTSLADVENLLSYFKTLEPKQGDWEMARRAEALLNQYGLRRLRLMESHEGLYSKQHYRHEQARPSNFEGRPDAELFFAFYQKRLIADLKRTNENKSLMYGYLEGFESVGRNLDDDPVTSGTQTNGEDERDPNDFQKAFDTDLLRELTKDYYEQLHELPRHPKYDAIVEQCLPGSLDDTSRQLTEFKHLIFVRRIPSVRELTQRFNAAYDDQLAGKLLRAWPASITEPLAKEWKDRGYPRDMVSRLVGTSGEPEAEKSPAEENLEPEEDDYLGSRIAGLFVTKKGPGSQTDCEGFRQRLIQPDRVYALFLEPAQDYLAEPYTHYYRKTDNKPDYVGAARHARVSRWSSSADLIEAVGDEAPPDSPFEQGRSLPTAWSLLVPHLKESHKPQYHTLQKWASGDKAVAENFGNYIKAGFLYASPVMVELYTWYVEFREKNPGRGDQAHYLKFVEWIRPRISESLMYRYFVAALSTFERLCGKIGDHGLRQWQREWTSLKRMTSPAWYASGDNSGSRQGVLLGFNSPFYPNVVVATSVFQEGVNLHLNCHQVHHYGLAGSPGDNEQRVGRVDRLFGCVNDRLQTQGEGDLSIFYPYLAQSVDQDQVGSFIIRKHHVERQLDACLQPKSEREIHLDHTDWEPFLRTPVSRKEAPITDPYPARLEGVETTNYTPQVTHTNDQLIQHIEACIQASIDPALEQYAKEDRVHDGVRTLFLVDPKIKFGTASRHQPIYVNKVFTPEISALLSGTAYRLNLISPLANELDLASYCETHPSGLELLVEQAHQLNQRYPLVQLRINEQAANSYFYLSAVVNLPLFVQVNELTMLSPEEMSMALQDLKYFTDELERFLFDSRDLPKDLVRQTVSFIPKTSFLRETGHSRASRRQALQWRHMQAAHGPATLLEHCFDNAQPMQVGHKLLGEKRFGSPAYMLLILNQRFPYARFEIQDDRLHVCIPFPAGDLQEKEKGYLETWFEYILSMGSFS